MLRLCDEAIENVVAQDDALARQQWKRAETGTDSSEPVEGLLVQGSIALVVAEHEHDTSPTRQRLLRIEDVS